MTLIAEKSLVHARDIAPPNRDESERIALRELDAFVALLEQLDESDWSQQTHCDLWDVRDVVAHQGGHVPAGRGLLGMFAQLSPRTLRPYQKRGMNALDAMNQAQVEMRREMTHAELIAEVRDGTARAIAARRNLRWPARIVRVPAPDYGLIPVDYLLHVIFPRDMWIHRLDVADATGRPLVISAGHDGELIPHVVRDMDRNVRKQRAGHSVRLTIDGPGGGTWLLGKGDEISVTMDIPTFMRASSSRIPVADRVATAEVATNDPELQHRIMASLVAVY